MKHIKITDKEAIKAFNESRAKFQSENKDIRATDQAVIKEVCNKYNKNKGVYI